MPLTSGAISVTSASASQIVLAGAVATGGTGPYTYQWYRSNDQGSTFVALAGQTTAASLTDATVSRGNLYYYKLESFDTVGLGSVSSNIVDALAVPAFSSSGLSPYQENNEVNKFVQSTAVPGQVAIAVVNPDGTNVGGGGGGGGTSSTVGAAAPTVATAAGATDGTNMRLLQVANAAPAGTEYGLIVRPILDADRQSLSQGLAALNAAATISTQGSGSAVVQVTGAFVGTISFEATLDGSNWFAVNAAPVTGGALVTTATAAGQWIIGTSGFAQTRVRVSAYTSGTATTSIAASAGSVATSMVTALPSGTNTIGYLKVTDGTNFAPTGDVAARAGYERITDGTNTMPTMDAIARKGFQAVTDGTNTAAVKAASTAAAATDPALVVAISPNNTVPVKPGDGTTSITVKAASTAAAAGDTSQVVALSPNSPVPTGTNTIGGVNLIPKANSGYTLARVMSAASTNATSTKASAGTLGGWSFFNTSAGTKFVKFYNKASSPTVGTDTPFLTVPLPAGGGSNIAIDAGMPMATGIAYAITGAVADSDTTAVAANDVVGGFLWI